MTDAKSIIGVCRNPQAAVREFEDDLDRLLDDLRLEITAALLDQYVPVHDAEDVRRIGNVVAVTNATIEDDLEESVDAAYADFAWELARLLRRLREAVR